jgi:hypothetical protein
MAKPKDPLATMSPSGRAKMIKAIATNVLGPALGAAFAKQMEEGLTYQGRQLGDSKEPEKNFWKGAWRIYEIE